MIFPWEVYYNNNIGNFKEMLPSVKSSPQNAMVAHTDNSSTHETKMDRLSLKSAKAMPSDLASKKQIKKKQQIKLN